MMRRYFVGQSDIDWGENRRVHKSCVPNRKRSGYVGLFDRNLNKYIWFKIVQQATNRYGYIVERGQPPTLYWRKTILEESDA